jgi:hypothetical protein
MFPMPINKFWRSGWWLLSKICPSLLPWFILANARAKENKEDTVSLEWLLDELFAQAPLDCRLADRLVRDGICGLSSAQLSVIRQACARHGERVYTFAWSPEVRTEGWRYSQNLK